MSSDGFFALCGLADFIAFFQNNIGYILCLFHTQSLMTRDREGREIKIIGINRGEVMHFSDSEISSEPRRLRTAIKKNVRSLLIKIMKNRLM